MVARPDVVDRFVEDSRTSGDPKRWTIMLSAADEDVVDSAERLIPIDDLWIDWCEGVAGIAWKYALPTIAVEKHSCRRAIGGLIKTE